MPIVGHPISNMRTFCLRFSAWIVAIGCIAAACKAPLKHEARAAITHVNVIDATGTATQPDMTVVIEGEKIAAIAPASKLKLDRDVTVTDGTGKFLIPGLV